jgi:hypothetical protein
MSIILDETMHEDTYLIKAVEAFNMPPWIKKSLVGKIETDIERKQKQKECSHEFAEYTGKKTCCSKCDAFGENMGFSWEIKM